MNLPISGSDHGPIVLTLYPNTYTTNNNFKFEAMWTNRIDFHPTVAQAWSLDLPGTPLTSFISRCTSLQVKLKHWSKNAFGNLFQKIKDLNAELELIQTQRMFNPHLICLVDKEHELLARLDDCFVQEEMFWAHRAHANWLTLGDRNTKFFQAQALLRRKRNRITSITDDYGCIITEPDDIANTFVSHFKQRFTAFLILIILLFSRLFLYRRFIRQFLALVL